MENALEINQTKLIEKYLPKMRFDQNKRLILFFLTGLIIILVANFFEKDTNNQSKRFFLDSAIPEGYVLVPISLANAESLASMIGRNGVVDLFLSKNGIKSKKVISKVKIIQANDDLNSFAVLLKENQSQQILTYEGPFFAVIQNPTAKSQERFMAGKKTITINYQK